MLLRHPAITERKECNTDTEPPEKPDVVKKRRRMYIVNGSYAQRGEKEEGKTPLCTPAVDRDGGGPVATSPPPNKVTIEIKNKAVASRT